MHGLWPIRLLCPWGSPGKNSGVGCYFLLQGIFLTQGSNPGIPHSRQTLYRLSHKGIKDKLFRYCKVPGLLFLPRICIIMKWSDRGLKRVQWICCNKEGSPGMHRCVRTSKQLENAWFSPTGQGAMTDSLTHFFCCCWRQGPLLEDFLALLEYVLIYALNKWTNNWICLLRN